MRSRTRTAFSLTLSSLIFILIGWIIPFWFGRWYETTKSKVQWGLFYRISCKYGRCVNIEGVLQTEHVDFGNASPPVELRAIAVLATIGFGVCLVGFFIVLIFHCNIFGKRHSYHMYVTAAAITQLIAVVFIFLTIIISFSSTGYFFSDIPMDSVIEFPWSALFYTIGEILLIASAVLLLLVTYHWKKYRHIYSRKRYYQNDDISHPYRGRYDRGIEPPLDYDDRQYRYEPYDQDSFVGYFRGRPDSRYYTDDVRTVRPDYSGYRNKDTPYYVYPDQKTAYNRPANLRYSNSNRYLPYSRMYRGYYGQQPRYYGDDVNDKKSRIWYTNNPLEDQYMYRNKAYGGYDVFM